MSAESDRKQFDLVVLALCLAVFAAALALPEPRSPDAALVIAGVEVPSTCLLHVATGTQCPFCGMTRSLAALFNGNIILSARLHPLGPAMALFLLMQVPYRAAALLPARRHHPVRNVAPGIRMAPFYIMVAALVIVWFARMATALATG